MIDFSYLIQKINSATFVQKPFPYIYIDNFLDFSHFNEITTSPCVNIHSSSIHELITNLRLHSWEPIVFPGCTINLDDYVRFINKQSSSYSKQPTCEGFGVTFRQQSSSSSTINALSSFFRSNLFLSAVTSKFKLQEQEYVVDTGLQKYLNHYEISPHPDIRKKALTFMLNLNPSSSSENNHHQTQFMSFKDSYKYIYDFWKYNHQFDRCWVPWQWCKTNFVHSKNNSITIFSPCDQSLHAVKANYDHFSYQRTQFYGNLWYKNSPKLIMPNWNDLNISANTNGACDKPLNQPSREQLF